MYIYLFVCIYVCVCVMLKLGYMHAYAMHARACKHIHACIQTHLMT